MKIEYEFSPAQVEKLKVWQEEQDQIWVESKQLVDPNNPTLPYYGAIGGSLEYIFQPTGIGMIVTVRHATGNELDLTDYDMW